jgi:uncharacterized protein (DUF58 family)
MAAPVAAQGKAWSWPQLPWRTRPGETPAWKRSLTFTRLGKWYCGLTVGIGLAAINTGNNLLFLVLGLLLGSIVVSGLLSESAVKQVRLSRRLPRSATVGEPALVGLVARRAGRLPAFSLELREAGGEVAGRAYLLVLHAGATQEVSYRFTPRRRGLHRLVQLEVATRSPFGFFEKARPLDAPGELLVFPRVVPPPPHELRAPGREGERPQQRVGHVQEFHGLRDHRDGEDVRSIHWKSSARAARLLAVEREEERRARVCVELDHRGLFGDALERAIEGAAALFVRALDQGAEAGLALSGFALPCASGADQLRLGLTALALAVPLPPHAPAPVPPPGVTLVVAPRGKG